MTRNDLRAEIVNANGPGQSVLDLLPRQWTHAPCDDGGWWLLGGDLAGDPDVMVKVEHAHPAAGRGDLAEAVALLFGRLVTRELGGRVVSTDLTAEEVAELSSQLRWLRTMMWSGR
ncbi:hypothetical protein [Saccharopolyspora phatthalungensis]|uniref:Uncharacterized protein n=1 Tax=Saccharopolyspora phatthalungensis TaxID=664693 RepID=A0A840QBP0_9PSEU|nr:hypothetical protein [Saccharopolyspora phatthalungensis]MBB5157357.1 hypothetical protein [Saccharopolyspora phatthalungensis]